MKVGDKVPDITLYDSDRKATSLKQYNGQNLLLLFFPFAFSGVCTAELCDMRDQLSYYNNLNVEVIGVSVDSLYSLAAYKKQEQLNFTLLSDFNKELSMAFEILHDTFPFYELKGVSKRAAFLIDKQGIVRFADVCENPKDLPDFTALQECLRSLD